MVTMNFHILVVETIELQEQEVLVILETLEVQLVSIMLLYLNQQIKQHLM